MNEQEIELIREQLYEINQTIHRLQTRDIFCGRRIEELDIERDKLLRELDRLESEVNDES